MSEQTLYLAISAVEKETRVSKELLRMWERRYGFPAPERDDAGDRIYTGETVEKLKLVRQLIDRGFRPGRLMPMPTAALRELQSGGDRLASSALPLTSGPGEALVTLLRRRDADALRYWFSQSLSEQGLRHFITQTLLQANEAVGLAWQCGQIAIHEEHLYTEQANSALRQAMQQLYPHRLPPRVMLTTLPEEGHGLGLLMVEVMLRLAQCDILSFGTELPLADIVEAAVAHRVDVLALSFSAAYGEANTRRMLAALASQLPAGVMIWVGGAGVRAFEGLPIDMQVITDLNRIDSAVAAWRAVHR